MLNRIEIVSHIHADINIQSFFLFHSVKHTHSHTNTHTTYIPVLINDAIKELCFCFCVFFYEN